MGTKKPTSKNATSKKPKATGAKASKVAVDPEKMKKVAGGIGGKNWGMW